MREIDWKSEKKRVDTLLKLKERSKSDDSADLLYMSTNSEPFINRAVKDFVRVTKYEGLRRALELSVGVIHRRVVNEPKISLIYDLNFVSKQKIRLSKGPVILSSAKDPVISVIINAHGSEELTISCVQSILSKTPLLSGIPYEIIAVVDKDANSSNIMNWVSGITIVHSESDMPSVSDFNKGLEFSKGRKIVFIMNSVDLKDGWLEPLLELSEKYEGAMVFPKQISSKGVLIEAGCTIYSDGSFVKRGLHENINKKQYMQVCEVDFSTPYCFFADRVNLINSGGFCEEYSIGLYNFIDSCLSFSCKGMKLLYQPQSTVCVCRKGQFGLFWDAVTDLESSSFEMFNNKWKDYLYDLHYYPGECKSFENICDKSKKLMLFVASEDTDLKYKTMRTSVIKLYLEIGVHVTFLSSSDDMYDESLEKIPGINHVVAKDIDLWIKSNMIYFDVIVLDGDVRADRHSKDLLASCNASIVSISENGCKVGLCSNIWVCADFSYVITTEDSKYELKSKEGITKEMIRALGLKKVDRTSDGKVRILDIAHYMLCPPTSGGALRIIAPLFRYDVNSELSFDFLFCGGNRETMYKCKKYLQRVPVIDRADFAYVYDHMLPSARMPEGFSEEIWRVMNSKILVKALEMVLESHYDVIQIEHTHMAWLVPALRLASPNSKFILDAHNVEYKLYESWLLHESNSAKRDLYEKYEALKKWEMETWKWFDAAFTVSSIEEKILQEEGGIKKTYLVPTGGGADLNKYRPKTEFSKSIDILYLGSMNWFPNVHGLMWFLNEVFPIIVKKCPGVTFKIVGNGTPNPKLMHLSKSIPGVEFLGFQEDDAKFFHLSRVFVVPLWIGAGARVKIPTAWASEVPVVSTTFGAEGSYADNGKNIFMADDPESFAESVIKLLKDPVISDELKVNAMNTVLAHYTVDHCAQILFEAYGDLISDQS